VRNARQDNEDRSRWSAMVAFIKTVPGILAAIAASLTAIATILTVIGTLESDGDEGAPAPTSQQPPTSGTTKTTATPPSTTTSTTLGYAGVFRETDGAPAVVASCIDLDSQEPNWGVGSRSHKDVCVSSGAMSEWINATRLTVVDGPPTLQDCQKQTVLRRSTTAAETVVGRHMCVRSSEDRWARLRIAAIDTSANTMSFDIVVWKLPSDP
jgi:hypothetical protein